MSWMQGIVRKIQDVLQEETNAEGGNYNYMVMEVVTVACLYDTKEDRYFYALYLDPKIPPHHHESLIQKGVDILDNMVYLSPEDEEYEEED